MGKLANCDLPSLRSMEFFGVHIYPNNINATNKRQKLWRKDTRVPACVRVCVPTCACAWVRGLLSRFFSRGCVRVGACAYACARVGGVGCKAAGTLARGQARWICTIHHEHKGISYSHPHEHKGIGYLPSPQPQGLSPPHNPKGYPFTTNPMAITSPHNLGAVYLSLGWLVGSSLVISLLAYCWVTGNRLLLVVCVGGVGVEGGGVFWVGCFSARLGNGLFFGRFPSLAVPCPIGAFSFVYQLARLGVGLIHAFRCWVGSIGFI